MDLIIVTIIVPALYIAWVWNWRQGEKHKERYERMKGGLCPGCGYNLTGRWGACPGCGCERQVFIRDDDDC